MDDATDRVSDVYHVSRQRVNYMFQSGSEDLTKTTVCVYTTFFLVLYSSEHWYSTRKILV